MTPDEIRDVRAALEGAGDHEVRVTLSRGGLVFAIVVFVDDDGALLLQRGDGDRMQLRHGEITAALVLGLASVATRKIVARERARWGRP